MRYQLFLTLSILSLVACSGDPVGANDKALHSAEPKADWEDQFSVDPPSHAVGDRNAPGTGSGGAGANHAGTGAAGSGGPTQTGGAGSGGPILTGSGGSCGPDATQAPAAAVCGNSFCEEGETVASCANDCCELTDTGACVAVCDNGFCEDGEDATCPSDCP